MKIKNNAQIRSLHVFVQSLASFMVRLLHEDDNRLPHNGTRYSTGMET